MSVLLGPGLAARLDCIFVEEVALRELGRGVRAHPTPIRLRDEACVEIVEALVPRANGSGLHFEEFDRHARSLARHVAHAHGERLEPGEARGLAPHALERVLALAAERLGQRLTVAELAAAAGCSVFHFIRCFKASTGRSPHAWLMLKRVSHAKTLLATTPLALRNVAWEVGFHTQAHFGALFVRVTGVTPGRYRERFARAAAPA